MPRSRFKFRADPLSDWDACVIAFILGLAIIVIFRGFITIPPLFAYFVAIILVIIISLYAYHVIGSRSGISFDRAGDNAYYLGLLFTLITLIVVLLKMGAHDSISAKILISDFGIALISTIAGIIARARIQHCHNDPTDIETQAAYDLNRASEQLRALLSKAIANIDKALSKAIANIDQAALKAVSEMNRTAKAMDVAAQEILNHTRKMLEESAKANAELFSSLSHKIDDPVHDFLDQIKLASAGMKEFSNTTNVAISHMEKHIAELEARTSLAEKDFKDLSVGIEQARQTIEKTKNQCQDFSSAIASFANEFSQLIPENILQQFHSAQDEMLQQQKQLLSQLNAQEQNVTRFKEQLSNAGSRASAVAEELEKGLASQFEIIREKAGQIEQGLGQINNKVPNITKDIEQEAVAIAKLEARTSLAEKDFKDLSVDIEQARQTIEAAKSQYQNFSSVMTGFADKFSQLIPENILQQFHSAQDEMLQQQRQLLAQLNTQEQDTMRFKQQLSNAGSKASAVTEELEKGLVSQFEIIREKAGQLEQELSQINNKVPNITKDIEQEETAVMSQLKGASAQLMDKQQKLMLAFESLHKKIQQTEENTYQPSAAGLQYKRRDSNIQQTENVDKPSALGLQDKRRDSNIQQTENVGKPITPEPQDKKRAWWWQRR